MTTLMDVARLDTCVTVVDASRFFDDLTSIEELADRHPDEVPEGDMRNIAQLLVEQVEFADVILLNKADTVSKAQLKDIRSLLHRLNPIASVHETVHSQIPLSEVLNTGRFDMEKAGQAPGWLQAINTANAAERTGQQAAAKSESEEYGVTSFVYTARRPFHPGRLYRKFMRRFFLTQVMPGEEEAEDDSKEGEESEEGSSESTDSMEPDAENGGRGREEGEEERSTGAERAEAHCDRPSDYQEARRAVLAEAKKELGSVMRSKGFFWLATQPNSVLGWSSAGALLQVTMEGPWFACVPKEEWPEDEDIQARIKADFCSDPEIGDRRQELVFIGQNLKEQAIRKLLDTCQATNAEIAAAVKGQLRDELFGGSEEEGSD
ncbi:cobalamin synthesis protein cobW C-terminal domain-containing protein [Dunaliella salina]|nr:cobalamin synthesis protein cobW C-terminal domain-containing protein [Dunaliella salina]|eukprot:KAF5829331.1 cobalamin synthesis protein cobW C-terminal domain-containing protein [Dunaliella salina]